MHFGAHWGNWGTAVVALVIGMLLIWRSRSSRRWNWAVAGGLALVLAVGTAINGWRVWPQQTTEYFIAVVYHGEHDQVRAMLAEPGQWTSADDGSTSILAEDNSTVTLTEDESHLVASGSPNKASVLRPRWNDFCAARRDFQMGSTTGRAVTMYCMAQHGRVRIRHVELVEGDK